MVCLTKIKELDLRWTEVPNIEPLKNLVNLQTLEIESTPISNLEPLKNLKNLQVLIAKDLSRLSLKFGLRPGNDEPTLRDPLLPVNSAG
jgi:Leucine-rich repeat (LRR) protein